MWRVRPYHGLAPVFVCQSFKILRSSFAKTTPKATGNRGKILSFRPFTRDFDVFSVGKGAQFFGQVMTSTSRKFLGPIHGVRFVMPWLWFNVFWLTTLRLLDTNEAKQSVYLEGLRIMNTGFSFSRLPRGNHGFFDREVRWGGVLTKYCGEKALRGGKDKGQASRDATACIT